LTVVPILRLHRQCSCAFATAVGVLGTECWVCELKRSTAGGGRALLPFYDPVATLPLDAAMMQGR
jgi:hypothetical protein